MAKKPKAAKPAKPQESMAPAEAQPPNKGGRPSIYSQELASEICQRLAEGESLRSICSDKHMPNKSTVISWVLEDRQGFYDQYTRARDIQLELEADEILDVADDGRNDYVERTGRDGQTTMAFDRENVERSKLRVDARKWRLTKLMPKKFGDKIEQTHKADEAFLGLWQSMGNSRDK